MRPPHCSLVCAPASHHCSTSSHIDIVNCAYFVDVHFFHPLDDGAVNSHLTINAESITLSKNPRGYQREDALQQEFEAAAEKLRDLDGWSNPAHDGQRELRADLALEGGGVKGIAHVGAVLVLDEAGYRFHRVAGTSAGAITASIIAAIVQSGASMSTLRTSLRSINFRRFMPEGKLHELVHRDAGHMAKLVADAAILTSREGLYSTEYLEEWLRPILHDQLGIKTFADLRLPNADVDPHAVPAQQYRLVVYTSDLTRSRLTRLPWDYSSYGVDPDLQDPVTAVRASMSVPFYFAPVRFEARETSVEVPESAGGSSMVHLPGGPHTWVDGALLAKFPIHTFDGVESGTPQWPTIGIKLSQSHPDVPTGNVRESALTIAVRCLRTMMNEWDANAPHESTAMRTIFVNNNGIGTMDFDLSEQDQDGLFLNGVEAATRFVINAARQGGVPRR